MRLSSVEYVENKVIEAILSGARKGHSVKTADTAKKDRQTHHSEVDYMEGKVPETSTV